MESERAAERIDVLIGGGGFAGLALAIALRQGLGPSFSVTVADPALGRASDDGVRPLSLPRRGDCLRPSAFGTRSRRSPFSTWS